jgi:Flp pilus assembly protein TadD
MDRKLLGRISVLSLMLGTATIACTPHGAAGPATLSQAPAKATEVAAKAAADARAALARHKGTDAVAAAERAVAASPRNADYRMLLGQSYLAAGRFASAETSFRDSLTLSPDQPRAKFDLALVETAQGRGSDARAVLTTLDGVVPTADLGLALTLAGDHDGGIAKLIEAARRQDSTARVRQNLALAYALDGKWRESRAVAMQDTPPNRIEGQMSDWAALAGPNQAQRQIALMLGVQPTQDNGLPTALALADQPASVQAPVAVALADPTPAQAPAPVAAPAPAPQATALNVPLDEAATPPAPVAIADAAPANVPPAAPAVPVMLAAAHPAPPALLRSTARPTHMDFAPNTQPIGRGGYVVQLGAYARSGAIETAWAQASRLSPQVATLSPVRGEYNLSGAMLVRLSVGGFADRARAVALCEKVRTRGGQCFVRAAYNDAPMQWAKRDEGKKVQLASN